MPETINMSSSPPRLMSQKKELLDKLSVCSGNTPEHTELLLNGFVEVLKEYSKEGDAVAIPGFGTFQPEKTDEWISESPDTGERYLNPPFVKLILKSSIVLRKKLLG